MPEARDKSALRFTQADDFYSLNLLLGNVPLNRQNLILLARYSLYGEEILVSRLIHVSGVDFVSRMICIQIEVKMNSRKDKQTFSLYSFLGKRTERKAGNKKETPSGFTLLEVMITVAIIGVLAGLAIGGIQNLLPKFRLNSAARQIRGDMQKCKMAAVRNNTECLMVFTEGNSTGDAGGYEACFSSNDNDCADASDTIVLTGDLNDDDFVGVWLYDAGFFGGNPKSFSFDSRGLASGNGGVNIKNNNDDIEVINVKRTGRIRIE